MENSRTKKTLLNAAMGIIVKIITIIASFATRTIFIYVLGIQYAGVSGVFTDILIVLSFAELGIGSAITFALYKPIAENNEVQISKYMSAYKTIYSVIALIVVAVGLCLLPFLQYIIKDVPDIVEDIRIIYLFYIVNTSVSYLLIYKSTFLTAVQKDYIVSKYKIVIYVVKTIAECSVLLIFKNFILYLTIQMIFVILQNYVIAKIADREYPILKQNSKLRLEKAEKKKLIEDVRALALYKVSGAVLNGTDSIITSTMLGTPVVGVLGNYTLISNQVYSFLMQVFTATSASIGNLAVEKPSDAQFKVFNTMNFVCFWLYCFCATCMWTLFNPFMTLWQGTDRLFTPLTVAMLVVDFFIRGLLSPISQFRNSNGLFIQGKYRPAIMAVLNIIISIILAKMIGMAGIILGTVISRALTQLWYDPWLIFRKVFHESVMHYFAEYMIYLFITVVSCFVSQQLLSIICPSVGFASLFVGLTICIIIPNAIIPVVFWRTENFKSVILLTKRIIRRDV